MLFFHCLSTDKYGVGDAHVSGRHAARVLFTLGPPNRIGVQVALNTVDASLNRKEVLSVSQVGVGISLMNTYRVVGVMALVLAEVLQTLGLITHAASELNRLATNTVTALGVSRAIHAGGSMKHRIAKVFQLSLREGILHPDLLACLALHPVECQLSCRVAKLGRGVGYFSGIWIRSNLKSSLASYF